MMNDAITLYNKTGEGEDGRATWQRTVIENVALFRYGGAKQYPARRLEADDRAMLYIFFVKARAGREYIAPEKFAAADDPSPYYTISEDGRDRLVEGICEEDSPPPEGALRPIGVHYLEKGSKRARHMKVTLR